MNTQPPERDTDSEIIVFVHSIFHTLQGEGPYAGCPAVFVRLAGCNLQCPLCDTEYTANRQVYDVTELVSDISQLRQKHNCRLVVITGGEPLRQASVPKLCERLLADGYSDVHVQIETNGTRSVADIPPDVTIVCSPKTSHIHPSLLADPNVHYKLVVGEGTLDDAGNVFSILGKKVKITLPDGAIVWAQPLDSGDDMINAANTKAALAYCMRTGSRFSFQLHKHLGLD
jgi:7-carboxy-7-deazaguanine synthase